MADRASLPPSSAFPRDWVCPKCRGTTNAFDEAAWLALWRLGLPLDALDEHAQRELTDADLASVAALVDERIATRKPAAYLTGAAWLQGVPFTIDERAPFGMMSLGLVEGAAERGTRVAAVTWDDLEKRVADAAAAGWRRTRSRPAGATA